MLSLGSETLAPYANAGADGAPLFSLPGPPGSKVPFLSYAPSAYMARLVELILKQAGQSLPLETIYETDRAEGLKAMTSEGHGLAFLPHSSVRKELKSKRLVAATPADAGLSVTMQVRIYRERPESARHPKAGVQALWEFLGNKGQP